MNKDREIEKRNKTELPAIFTHDNSLVFKPGKRIEEVPPGQYEAIVTNISEGKFMKKQHLCFTFTIINGGYGGIQLNGYVNTCYESFTKFSKLGRWWEILTGEDLNMSEEIDVNQFKGKFFIVEVKKTTSKFKNSFSNVKDILKLIDEI